jgi:hypothetical protein
MRPPLLQVNDLDVGVGVQPDLPERDAGGDVGGVTLGPDGDLLALQVGRGLDGRRDLEDVGIDRHQGGDELAVGALGGGVDELRAGGVDDLDLAGQQRGDADRAPAELLEVDVEPVRGEDGGAAARAVPAADRGGGGRARPARDDPRPRSTS